MSSVGYFHKILVPVDDSVPSLAAQELAASIAKKYGSEITVLHVVSHALMSPTVLNLATEIGEQEFAPSQIARGEYSMPRAIAPPDEGRPSAKGVVGEISNWFHERGNEVVDEAVRLFKEQGVKADKRIVENSDPASAIIRQVEDEDYDSVIMGRSGEKGKQPHLGSTAQKVAQHAKVPVLVVADSTNASRILVPVDGSYAAQKALKYAVDLAGRTGGKITLVHVQEPGLSRIKPEITKSIGNTILSDAAAKLKNVEFDKSLRSGSPGSVITQMANEDKYDLIVMGDKGHSRARKFLLGSVSNHVLHYSSRSILIVK